MTNSTTGLVEIKGCPFCGATADAPIEKVVHVSMSEHDWRDASWTVQCDNCSGTHGYFDSEDEAIDHWNTRPTDPTIAELVAALEPFGDLRVQHGAYGVITKALDGFAPMTVTVTKTQMIAALNALTKARSAL